MLFENSKPSEKISSAGKKKPYKKYQVESFEKKSVYAYHHRHAHKPRLPSSINNEIIIIIK